MLFYTKKGVYYIYFSTPVGKMEIKNENYMEGCAKMSKLAINGGIPVGVVNVPKWPIFDQTEIDAVTEVVNSGTWGLGGTKVPEFEEKFAAFCGAKYGITAFNGTVTLRLALEALGVGPGDEVIVPGLTFQATAASVLDVNAIPIIVDIDPNTFTIDPKAIEAAISTRTKCIVPVHLYGRVADMDAIMAIAKKYNLFVLEDCAHQHGPEWNGKRSVDREYRFLQPAVVEGYYSERGNHDYERRQAQRPAEVAQTYRIADPSRRAMHAKRQLQVVGIPGGNTDCADVKA